MLYGRYYTTPKSYLDLISLYTGLLHAKQAETDEARARLLTGLAKLHDTNALVDTMQAELMLLQPVLDNHSKVI